MAAASLCSRKRSCGTSELQLLQEAECQPPFCKRRYREEEEEMKRKRGGCKENKNPGEDLQEHQRSQNLKREPRRFSKSRISTRNTVCTGSKSTVQIQFSKPQVRMALIRKTRIQTAVQNVELRSAGSKLVQGLSLIDQSDPGSTEMQLDHRLATQDRQTRITEPISEVRSRSTAVLVPDKSLHIRTRTRRRSAKYMGPESCKGKEHLLKTRSSFVARTETKTRRRRKVHPSVFRGRGQLQLSITPGAGQLNIHIHEARGLMGKSQRSCDSYVKLTVTSDLGHRIRMKTQTVPNNKNPKYNRDFVLCVSDYLLHDRLLVSVFRRPDDSRCSQLIGCMSFGIGSLVSSSKLVIGWFYLLGEEFGQKKHLRVTSQQSRRMRSSEEDGLTESSEFKIRPKLTADLRRTPDSAPDTDLNHITTSSGGHKDSTSHSLTCSHPHSLGPPNSNQSSTNTNQCQGTKDCSSTQRLMVSIVRGKDGFGFTICSDCPVRVQAVDPGGPAHQSGLRQGDSVLQLNGLPVETWKCVDLAHAIRSSSHIVLVVWRGLPELRSGYEGLLRPPAHSKTTGRKLLPNPTHSKHSHSWGQGSGVRSSLGALGSLWRDKKEDRKEVEEEENQEVTEYSPHTTTLKGTHVTSSNGDNYIILSPVNPGEQPLQPVYHDGTGTIGRLYQTHPSRSQNNLQDPRPGSSRRTFTNCTATLPPPPSSASTSSAPPSNYSNYQNCTIVQSHLPCTYGTYVTLTPKTLIFPVFVQPLDLCSPDRTLLMSEEMILHQADLLPAKVTVLIYSDLLLLTREDEAGRCNVLQSPLYLNTLQLREVSSEPLHIYVMQNSQTSCRFLFSLECFSIEQKVKVSLCLHDNIHLQLVTTDTTHRPQIPDYPCDFGLLSLGQADLLLRPSSPYSSLGSDLLRPPSPSPYSSTFLFPSTPPPPLPLSSLSSYPSSSHPPRSITTAPHLPPPPLPSSSPLRNLVWKERGRTQEEEKRKKSQEEEVEERQQGEGESASETSENVGGVVQRGFLFSPHHFNMKEEESSEDEEEGRGAEKVSSSFRPAVLRRSLSEGSLLQEPRSPRFLSDSTIHQLTRPVTFDLETRLGLDPRPPSPYTLRKQLTKKEGSLYQMLLLLNSTKDPESRNLQLRKKTSSLAADVRSRLPFLRRRKNNSCFHSNILEKALRNNRPSIGEVLSWAESLEALLTSQYGLAVFRHFLRSEFSEENLDFWLAVERFKKTHPLSKMAARAEKIYAKFISTSAVRQVNVDSSVRESTNQSLRLGVHPASFQLAQDQVFALMETDSYPRFLKSRLYIQLTSHGSATRLANHSEARSVPVSQS